MASQTRDFIHPQRFLHIKKEESLEIYFHGGRGGGGESDGCVDEEGTVLLYSGMKT